MGIEFEGAPNECILGDGIGRRGRVRLRSLASVKNANANSGPSPSLKPRPMSYVQVSEGFRERESRETGVEGYEHTHHRWTPDGEQPRDSLSMVINRDGDSQEPPQHSEHRRSLKPRESTMRRRKRFSLPAIALQPLNVIARTVAVSSGGGPANNGGNDTAGTNGVKVTSSRRFSLVLGSRNASRSSVSLALGGVGNSDVQSRQGEADSRGASVVMGKLSELLKSSKTRMG